MASNCLPLSVASYNCRGFHSTKSQCVETLLSQVSILFLQEHWLADNQLQGLGGIDSRFLYSSVSGFGNTDILQGRPFEGCAIMWTEGQTCALMLVMM